VLSAVLGRGAHQGRCPGPGQAGSCCRSSLRRRRGAVLASDTRLRLLHLLARHGEIRVGDLATEIGMTQQAVSNQLRRLIDQGILATRRNGNSIYYRIVDSCVPALLELGWCLVDSQ
jgi:DNA-binding transcriptional ArsR family regulator